MADSDRQSGTPGAGILTPATKALIALTAVVALAVIVWRQCAGVTTPTPQTPAPDTRTGQGAGVASKASDTSPTEIASLKRELADMRAALQAKEEAARREVPASAKDAIAALKKFQGRIEIGIQKKDYKPCLGEVWGQVRIFVDSPDGRRLKEAAALMVEVCTEYQAAERSWDIHLKSEDDIAEWMRVYRDGYRLPPPTDPTIRALHAKYVERLVASEDEMQEHWKKAAEKTSAAEVCLQR
jgi:hypothetical protein